MIKISDLHISYGEKPVLKDVNASFIPGEIKGIIGYNGAGKTSLFNCMCGIVPAQGGSITYNNEPLTLNHVLYLEAENYFYPQLTGREFLDITPGKNNKFNADELAKLFRLNLDELVDTYSTGMKKKLIMLFLLKTNKPIIILDEPFNGLDLETHQLLEIILKELKKQNKIIIVTSHIIEPLAVICDSILFLNEGHFQKEIQKASVEEIRKQMVNSEVREIEEKIGAFF
jgi:ABC-2 type transport system ATP-binding protein